MTRDTQIDIVLPTDYDKEPRVYIDGERVTNIHHIHYVYNGGGQQRIMVQLENGLTYTKEGEI